MRKRFQKGQAAVELCFVLPVCLLLFMGVYTAGSFISDLNVAGQATRAGSRLGAEVGNYGYGPAGAPSTICMKAKNDPCAVDQNIVTTITTVAKGMNNISSFDEIDIYDPCSASGADCTSSSSLCNDSSGIGGTFVPSEDPYDKYTLVGGVWTLQGNANFTLDMRTQRHPNELAVGVRLVYHFQASAPIQFFNMQTSQYSVMCFAPLETGT
jgi:hypothetical protein